MDLKSEICIRTGSGSDRPDAPTISKDGSSTSAEATEDRDTRVERFWPVATALGSDTDLRTENLTSNI